MKKYGYHAGPLDKDYKSENLSIGLHGTSSVSGTFFVLDPREVEYHGAGLNGEHKQDIHKIDLSGLNLIPLNASDYKVLGKYDRAMYHFPVWIEYCSAAYKDLDRAFDLCFDSFYCDETPIEEKAEKFVRELYDGYKIEANDMSEIDGEHYSFQEYVNDTRSLKHLRAVLNDLPSDLHNTLPAWQSLLNGGYEVLKESYKGFDTKTISDYIKGIANLKSKDLLEKEENGYPIIYQLAQYLNKLGVAISLIDGDKDTGWISTYIEKAGTLPDGIDIYIDKDSVYEMFANDEEVSKKEFARELSNVLVHELVHVYQKGKYSQRGYEQNYYSDEYSYISTQDEIAAHAIGGVQEALDLGYTKDQILDKLSSHSSAIDFLSSLDETNLYSQYEDSDAFKSLVRKMANFLLSNLNESRELNEDSSFNKQDLIDQLDNYLDKRETCNWISKVLNEVSETIDIDMDQLYDFSIELCEKYEDLYDPNTGRFNNFKAPEDDNFATQLLLYLGYDGVYPLPSADNTTWGGCIFHFDKATLTIKKEK